MEREREEEEDMKLGWGELERESGTIRMCLTHVWNFQRTDRTSFQKRVNGLGGHKVGWIREGNESGMS